MTTHLTAGQAWKQADVSAKALRGYEERGLVSPTRGANGHRFFDPQQVAVIAQIGRLNDLGIPPRDVRPFVDCLNAGSPHADDCPSSLAEYRHAIDRIDRTVQMLQSQPAAIVTNLTTAGERLIRENADVDARNPGLAPLPADLPAPVDDGAADHLAGSSLPRHCGCRTRS